MQESATTEKRTDASRQPTGKPKSGPARRWGFIYGHDRWTSGRNNRARAYSARSFAEACGKMLAFFLRKGWQPENVQVDCEVYEYRQPGNMEHASHLIEDHPLAEFVV